MSTAKAPAAPSGRICEKVKSRKLHEPDYVKAENRTITSIMLIKEVYDRPKNSLATSDSLVPCSALISSLHVAPSSAALRHALSIW